MPGSMAARTWAMRLRGTGHWQGDHLVFLFPCVCVCVARPSISECNCVSESEEDGCQGRVMVLDLYCSSWSSCIGKCGMELGRVVSKVKHKAVLLLFPFLSSWPRSLLLLVPGVFFWNSSSSSHGVEFHPLVGVIPHDTRSRRRASCLFEPGQVLLITPRPCWIFVSSCPRPVDKRIYMKPTLASSA